jgi:hypothetical protein
MDVAAYTSGAVRWQYGTANGTLRKSVATFTEYRTQVALNYIIIYAIDAGPTTVDLDNVSYKRILTPSATGVTIVSTRGGSTQSWASQESGFNYNDASGYTYVIRRISYNPAHTEYALQDEPSGLYVHKYSPVCSLKAGAEWGTYSYWGGASGVNVAVGVGKKYTIRAKARSGE